MWHRDNHLRCFSLHATVRLRRQRNEREKQIEREKKKKLCWLSLCLRPCVMQQQQQPLRGKKAQQYMQRLGKGPFAPRRHDICLLPHALSHRVGARERGRDSVGVSARCRRSAFFEGVKVSANDASKDVVWTQTQRRL